MSGVLDAEIVVVDWTRLLDGLAARKDADVRRGLAAERGALAEAQTFRNPESAERDGSPQDRRVAIERRRDLFHRERHAGGDRARCVDAPAIDRRRLLVLACQKVQRRVGRREFALHQQIGARPVQHQEGEISFRRHIARGVTLAPGKTPEAVRIILRDTVNHLVGRSAAHGLPGPRQQRFDILVGRIKYNHPLGNIGGSGRSKPEFGLFWLGKQHSRSTRGIPVVDGHGGAPVAKDSDLRIDYSDRRGTVCR